MIISTKIKLELKVVNIGFYGFSERYMAYDVGRLDNKCFYLLRGIVRTIKRLFYRG